MQGRSVLGSPFTVTVVDPSKLLIAGASTDRPEGVPIRVGVQKEVKIDTSAAGPGKLRAEVRGPSGKLQTKLEEAGHGQHKLLFTPTQEGTCPCSISW